VQDLYRPDSRSETRGSSPDNHLVVGAIWPGHERGVVWDNGVSQVMAPPPNSTDSITPNGVNNSGVVVGRHRACSNRNGEFYYRAFRYQNGAYEHLYTASEEESQAIGINESGDIIGQVWQVSAPGARWVALWPRDNQPRRLYLKGEAVGITDDRKLVVAQDPHGSNPKVWAIDGNTGGWTAFPGARTPAVLDDERVLTYDGVNGPQIQEWTLVARSRPQLRRHGVRPERDQYREQPVARQLPHRRGRRQAALRVPLRRHHRQRSADRHLPGCGGSRPRGSLVLLVIGSRPGYLVVAWGSFRGKLETQKRWFWAVRSTDGRLDRHGSAGRGGRRVPGAGPAVAGGCARRQDDRHVRQRPDRR
jgi:hypothetical protein